MKNKDKLFINIVNEMATQSTCLRRKVGAVIVKDNMILSTGYNGAPSGLRHCSEVGCLRQQQNIKSGTQSELCRGSHAEMNALIQCALKHTNPEGATVYCSAHPCCWCTKMLINAKIKEIVYIEYYNDELARDLLKETEIIVRKYEK